MSADPHSDRLGFGEFEIDLRSRELWRGDTRVPLQQKAFLVLRECVRRPGEVITRDELVAALWPQGYYVDAEHGVNTAVRRLREALGDSAADSRYLETLPKLGYRFVGQVRVVPAPAIAGGEVPETPLSPPEAAPPIVTESRAVWHRRVAALVAAALVAGLAVVGWRSGSATTISGATPGTTDVVEELLARSRYLRNVKRLPEAKRFVEQAQALAPDHPHVLGGLSLSLLGERRDDEARATALRAIAIDDGAWEAHRTLGVLAVGAGDYVAAERHLRRAMTAGPADAKSHTRFARHLLQIGRFEEARPIIVDARRLAPDDPDVQNIWMEYALRIGDFASAVREGERWLAIWAGPIDGAPTPVVRDMLGLAYLGSGRYTEALAQFRAIDPDDDLRVALVYAYAGRRDEARAILEAHERRAAAAPVDPGHAGAMAMTYVALGAFDRALVHLERQRTARLFPSWINCRLFDGIRAAPGYAVFARQLDRDYFSGAAVVRPSNTGGVMASTLQDWPRPTRAGRG